MAEQDAIVLIVEDEPPLARALTKGLETAGYRSVWASTGEEALDRAAYEVVDLVLLDVGLPDLGGLEVCRRLRALPRERYLPILMLTAFVSPSDRLAGFQAGADDYVPKPFRLEELLARVGVWLGVRAREQALGAAADAEREARLAAEARLAQAQAALEAVRTLAHRLNQPLSEVVGYGELLEAGDAPPALVLEYAGLILTAGRDIANLNRQMGEQARAASGGAPPRPDADEPR